MHSSDKIQNVPAENRNMNPDKNTEHVTEIGHARKNKKWPYIAACALVLAGILALSSFMSWLLFPYLEMRHTIHVMSRPDYDTLIVGTSHGKAGIDPAILRNECGMTAINACLGNERMVDTFYLVRYAAEHTDLKCVILEVDPSYWVLPPYVTPDSLRIYHEMPRGRLKAEYAFDKLRREDSRNVFFEWYLYRNQIFNIKDRWEEKHSEEYRNYDIKRFSNAEQTYRADGFMSINRPTENKEKTDEPVEWNPDNVAHDVLPMLDRLQGYCRKKEIKLVCVTTPIPRSTYEKGLPKTQDSENYMQSRMDERSLDYFNYMNASRDGISTNPEDFNDNDGHMYWDTAQNFTKVFAQDINKMLNSEA